MKYLQDPEEAIACLEVLLEETEEDPAVRDCAFIRAITAVTEAQIAAGRSRPEPARKALGQLVEALSQPGAGLLYAWVAWLGAMGLGWSLRFDPARP